MSSTSCWCLIGKIVIVWLCFGISQGYKCGKFQYKNNLGKCSVCRKCPDNYDIFNQGSHIDDCVNTAKPTPEWLQGSYWCQGLSYPYPECEKWSPENGSLLCNNGMKLGTICRLDCAKDFYASLNESVECTGDLKWNKPLPYCVHVNDPITTAPPPMCPALSPTNGYMTCTKRRDVGSTCTLSCNHGFHPSSNHIVNCLEKQEWDKQLPSCVPVLTTTTPKPSCPPLEIENGTLYCSEDSFSGSECWVLCDEGFSLSANITVSCTDNSTWSYPIPSCVEIPTPKCDNIAVENGTVSCTMDFDVGSYCNVTCTGAFKSNSSETLYCRPDQTWSPPIPFCFSLVPEGHSREPVESDLTLTILLIIIAICALVILVICLVVWLKRRRTNQENSVKKPEVLDGNESEPLNGADHSDCQSCGQSSFCSCFRTEKNGNCKYDRKRFSDQSIDKGGGLSNKANSATASSLNETNSTTGGSRSSSTTGGSRSNSNAGSLPIPNSEAEVDRVDEVLPVNRPNRRRSSPITKESASAQALKAVFNDLDDMNKLIVLFDQSLQPNKINWKTLAAKILKLNTEEIHHIEYRFKENTNNGPTFVIFMKMKEKAITLFEVIKCLQTESAQSNVQEALDILYKYCGNQENAIVT